METTGRVHGSSSFSSAMPRVTVQHAALLALCLQTTALPDRDLCTLSCPENVLRAELTTKLPCPPAWDLFFMACAVIGRCRLLSLSSPHDFPPLFSSSGDSMHPPTHTQQAHMHAYARFPRSSCEQSFGKQMLYMTECSQGRQP